MREPVEYSHVEIWKGDDEWFAEIRCQTSGPIELDIEVCFNTVYFMCDDIHAKYFAMTCGEYVVSKCIQCENRNEIAEKIRHQDYWDEKRYG